MFVSSPAASLLRLYSLSAALTRVYFYSHGSRHTGVGMCFTYREFDKPSQNACTRFTSAVHPRDVGVARRNKTSPRDSATSTAAVPAEG